MADSPPTVSQPFPCFVIDCPWEASLRDGMWLCDNHAEGAYVWGEEHTVVYPKIREMDERIRAACERLIRHLHQDPDAFSMMMRLTNVAAGLERKTKDMPAPRGKGGISV